MDVGVSFSNPTDEIPTHLQGWSIKSRLNKAYEERRVDINDLNMLGGCVTISCSI